MPPNWLKELENSSKSYKGNFVKHEILGIEFVTQLFSWAGSRQIARKTIYYIADCYFTHLIFFAGGGARKQYFQAVIFNA